MTIKLLTLFPDAIKPYTQSSMLKIAQEKGLCTIEVIDIRDYAHNKHRRVDDIPYGGGSGMVLQVEVLDEVISHHKPLENPIIFTSPKGKLLKQSMLENFAIFKELVIVCGHYEDVDARIFELYPDNEKISIGDFVLTGGELPALAIVDGVVRLLEGVLGNKDSLDTESFNEGRLDFDHYSRPSVYKNLEVPKIFLSGDHKSINFVRTYNSLIDTFEHRPDLFASYPLSEEEIEMLKTYLREKYNDEQI